MSAKQNFHASAKLEAWHTAETGHPAIRDCMMALSRNTRFETHLTLHVEGESRLKNTYNWAKGHNLKWTHIVLDRGNTPSQPMVTFRGATTLEEQITTAKSLMCELSKLDAHVVRIKVELELPPVKMQIELPTSPLPDNQYFEHHAKLLLSPDTDLDQLSSRLMQHGGHLSRNARRERKDGMIERFVTLRTYSTDRSSSYHRFSQLTNAIRKADVEIIESEHEFVLYDTNFELDSGWMGKE